MPRELEHLFTIAFSMPRKFEHLFTIRAHSVIYAQITVLNTT